MFFRNIIFLLIFLFFLFKNLLFSQDLFYNNSLPKKSDVIDTIRYDSKLIKYDIKTGKIYLIENAKVYYKNFVLNSDSIYIDLDSSLFYAVEHLFIVVKDKGKRDTIFLDSLIYNMKKDKGLFYNVKSRYDNAIYFFFVVKKENKHTYYGKHGFYTTDIDTSPGYYFYTKYVKIKEDKKVIIAKPIVLVIVDVPVTLIPYYIYPYEKKRKSGFLRPVWGGSESFGRYIRNVGYYWAINDYMDLELNSTFYEGRYVSYMIKYNFVYRYWVPLSSWLFRETRNIDYFFNETQRSRYISVSHTNYLDYNKNFKISINGNYTSNKFFMDSLEYDEQTLLNRNIILTGTFSGKITENTMINLTVKRDQKIDLKQITWNKPYFSLYMPEIRYLTLKRLFSSDRYWYYFKNSPNYNSIANSEINRYYFKYSPINFLRVEFYDDSNFVYYKRWGWSVPISIGRDPFKLYYFNISPTLNISNVGMSFFKDSVRIYKSDTLYVDTLVYKDSIVSVTSYRMSMAFSTRIYGISRFNILGLRGIKHTLSPSIVLSYSPGIEEPYHYEPLVGTIYSSKEKTISLNLNQDISTKFQKNDTSKVYYTTLFILGSRIFYNFNVEDKKLSMLTNSLSIPWLPFFGASFIVDFYGDDSVYSLKNTNVYSYTYSLRFPINLRGYIFNGDLRDFNKKSREKYSNISFSTGLFINYSAIRVTDDLYKKTKTYSTNFSLTLNLTKTSKLSSSLYYDLEKGKVVNISFNFEKQIRRWKMTMLWVPMGVIKRWEFKVYLIDLPDIKVEKKLSF